MSTTTKNPLFEKRAALLAKAQKIVDAADAKGRDLSVTDAANVKATLAEVDKIDALIEDGRKSAELIAKLTAPYHGSGATKADNGSAWARSVGTQLASAAGQIGVKALLQGEVPTPSVVDVAELPATPRRLLDLIVRETLAQPTFAYLRQTARKWNAAVVPDHALKPTSQFQFAEVEDRARVIAHLSEPFALRYLEDHESLIQVLDEEMAGGVFHKLEQQILAGTGKNADDDDLSELPGLLTTTGTTAVAFASDLLTTVRKARTALENKGEIPNAWVFHPEDVEAFELMREDGATGGFLMDSGAYETVFGPGVLRVPSLAVPKGTAILGDWSQLRLQVREGVSTLAATQAGDLFAKNQVMLRSEGRFGLKHRRPQAFAIVSLTS